ncbi:hypothetical protein HDV00_003280 [Rhizophlyctis rosea]|nr:hypothetical protein HDV00_003280 [Rhizophlyctis rosea]
MSYYPANTQEQEERSRGIESERGLGRNEMIAGGVLGTAAALGLGYLAYDKYQDHQEDAAQTSWNEKNWLAEAAQRQKTFLESVQSGAKLAPVSWILTEGNQIPQGAIRGGNEADGSPLYIARTFHDNGIHVGKASHKLKGAHIAYGGKEVEKPKYEVLCGFESAVRWVDDQGALNVQPGVTPVEGGREEDGTPLYIAQAYYKNAVTPGKASTQLKDGAYIAFDNDEVKVKNYRYLAYAQQ